MAYNGLQTDQTSEILVQPLNFFLIPSINSPSTKTLHFIFLADKGFALPPPPPSGRLALFYQNIHLSCYYWHGLVLLLRFWKQNTKKSFFVIFYPSLKKNSKCTPLNKKFVNLSTIHIFYVDQGPKRYLGRGDPIISLAETLDDGIVNSNRLGYLQINFLYLQTISQITDNFSFSHFIKKIYIYI